MIHCIAEIDRKIFGCVSEVLSSEQVIITDERIAHIKMRHPEVYERFHKYLPKIIQEPDYILEANKPSTIVILKEIVEEGRRFQVVVKLMTVQDDSGKQNSIITFLEINRRTWEKYLRNKEILYRKKET